MKQQAPTPELKTCAEVASVDLRKLHEAWLAAEMNGDIEELKDIVASDLARGTHLWSFGGKERNGGWHW